MRFSRVLFSIIFGFFFLYQNVSAATVLQLSPRIVEVKEGEKFTLTVQAVPNGDKDFTVRMVAEFSPELLSVFSWSYVGDWMPLRKAGYDALDNDNGVLTKTGGFPEGFTSQTTFGTITFLAKKSGTASIRIGIESLVLNDKSVNVLAIGQPTEVNIKAPVVPVSPVLVPKPLTKQKEQLKKEIPIPVLPISSPETQKSADTISSPTVENIISTPTGEDEKSKENKKSLSVKLELNSVTFEDAADLVAVVTVQNMSKNAAVVNFEQSILDENGNKIFSKKWKGSVAEQKTKILEFKDLDLPDGTYSLYITVNEEGKESYSEGKSFSIRSNFFRQALSPLGIIAVLLTTLMLAVLIRVYVKIKARTPIQNKIFK